MGFKKVRMYYRIKEIQQDRRIKHNMNILICDDEPQILHQISEKVHNDFPEWQIMKVGNSTELLGLLQEQECDILLLDIDMPVINGLDIARRLENLKKKPLLIFVTSHDELVYDSLQFHPFGFVRKSYLETELPRVLQDSEKEISSHSRHYHFRTSEGEIKLLLDDILYFESEGNYISVYAKDISYRFRETITTLQNTLENFGFIRIHRGFLVNQSAVEVLGTDELKLYNGMKLPIGRNYAETAKKRMMRYMLQ